MHTYNSFEPNNRHNLDISSNFVDEEQSGLITEIISRHGLEKDLKSITGCKRPAFNVGKKKRAYKQCLADYQDKITAQGDTVAQAELKVAQAKEEADIAKKQLADASTKQMADSTGSGDGQGSGDGKILGMSKGLAIGLGIVVLAIGGFIAYKVIKARKK